jgi:hypothetical protein
LRSTARGLFAEPTGHRHALRSATLHPDLRRAVRPALHRPSSTTPPSAPCRSPLGPACTRSGSPVRACGAPPRSNPNSSASMSSTPCLALQRRPSRGQTLKSATELMEEAVAGDSPDSHRASDPTVAFVDLVGFTPCRPSSATPRQRTWPASSLSGSSRSPWVMAAGSSRPWVTAPCSSSTAHRRPWPRPLTCWWSSPGWDCHRCESAAGCGPIRRFLTQHRQPGRPHHRLRAAQRGPGVFVGAAGIG